MSERVQCAECERVYDSDEHPFCPRCGGTKHSDPIVAARSIASRSDPRRRRVQVAGIIMVSTGSLVLLAGIAMVASAGAVWGFAASMDDATAAGFTQTTPTINVTVFMDGEPVEGANVTLESGQMEFIADRVTDADGVARFEDITAFVVDLRVSHGDVDWDTSFIAVNPTDDPEYVMDVHVDLAEQAVVNGPLLDQKTVETTTRIMGIGALLLGIAPVMGGIAALRLRNQQLALMGSVIGAVPWLFMFVASMSLSMLLIMVLFVMATVFVRQGRDLFA